MRAAPWAYSGPEETLIGIDVSNSVQQLLIEQGCLHGRFAPMKKPLKIRQADSQGLASRPLELMAPYFQPPEAARIYKMQLSSRLKMCDEVRMFRRQGILANHDHATGHPQMYYPLAPVVKIKNNVFPDAPHPLHRCSLERLDNIPWSRFERLGLAAEPD
jgi:hypothetical protein